MMNWIGELISSALVALIGTFIAYHLVVYFSPELAGRVELVYVMYIGCLMGSFSQTINKLHTKIDDMKKLYGKDIK